MPAATAEVAHSTLSLPQLNQPTETSARDVASIKPRLLCPLRWAVGTDCAVRESRAQGALLRTRIRAAVGLDRAIREPLIAITTATRSSPLTTRGGGGIVEFLFNGGAPATPPYRPMWSTRIGDPRPRFIFSGFAPWQTTASHATTVAARSLTAAARMTAAARRERASRAGKAAALARRKKQKSDAP